MAPRAKQPSTEQKQAAKKPALAKPKPVTNPMKPDAKRSYLKQADVPGASLEDALRVPQAIFDNYAGQPTAPLHVALALNVDPKGSQIRVLTGAAIAFGLIDGGAQAASVSVTPLSKSILRPTAEGEDIEARKTAVLKPRVFGDFLRSYDGNTFPRDDLAINVIEGMGVPRDKASEVIQRILHSAESVGFIQEMRGKLYVSLTAPPRGSHASDVPPLQHEPVPDPATDSALVEDAPREVLRQSPHLPVRTTLEAAFVDDQRRRRVFITHGRDRAFVEPIKKLLEYGELEPVVSVERQSVSKPVPEKVMDDMRGAGAAIIHVDADQTLVDANGAEHVFINPNVLIEIGAAMAFYGRRFILLVKAGVRLPSNLQGLYEVRYSGETLDAAATIKLLEAMKDIKNYSLPMGDALDDS